MTYGTIANIRAFTGLTTSEVADSVLTTLITAMDTQVDQYAGVSLSTAQKALVSDYLCSALAIENSSGTIATSNLLEIVGAIRLDTRTSEVIRTNQSKRFWEKAQEILAHAPDTDLIIKVE